MNESTITSIITPAINRTISDISVIRSSMLDQLTLPSEIIVEIFKYVISGTIIAAKNKLQKMLRYSVRDHGDINLFCTGDLINPNSNHPNLYYSIGYRDQKLVAKAYRLQGKSIKIDVPDDAFGRIANKYYRTKYERIGDSIYFQQ